MADNAHIANDRAHATTTWRCLVRQELNILALIKGAERYVFVYDDDSRETLLDALRDRAADPRFSFNWFDAALMTEKAREQAKSAKPTCRQ